MTGTAKGLGRKPDPMFLARALRTLLRDFRRADNCLEFDLNVSRLAKVTPKNFGVFLRVFGCGQRVIGEPVIKEA